MPEGDTILRTARTLDRALAGKRIAAFTAPRVRRRLWPEAGTTVTAVEARGKHLLVHFDDGLSLHTHMGMPGSWHVYRTGERWQRPAYLVRVRIDTDDGIVAVCFNAPTVEIVRRAAGDDQIRHQRLDSLGPDLCHADADLDVVLARLDALAPDTEIGDALLDQRVASGVGNVYKNEALFASGVDPFTPVAALPTDLRRHVFATASRLLRANLDGPVRRTSATGHAVYHRRGRPCPRCGTAIAARRQGVHHRMTYWCPQCQTRPPAM